MAITNQAINQGLSTEGSGAPTAHEIFTQINNAKDKPKKIAVLKEHDTPGLRKMIKGSFDPNIKSKGPFLTSLFDLSSFPIGTSSKAMFGKERHRYERIV